MKNIKLLIIQVNQYALSNKKKKKEYVDAVMQKQSKKKKCIINGTKKIINLSDKYITHQTTQNCTFLPKLLSRKWHYLIHHIYIHTYIELKLRENSIRF